MLRFSRIIASGYIIATILVTIATVIVGPIGWAPWPLPTAAPPIQVQLAVSSEKEEWIRSALERFARSNPTVNGRAIKVTLRATGSRELISAIQNDGYQPTAISPASRIQLAELQRLQPTIVGSSAQPLVFTPLVALLSKPPATTDIQDPWQALFDNRVRVKIGISSPEQSNGGLQTLVVLAARYHQSTSLTLDQARDPKLRDWLAELNRRVADWPPSTGKLTTDFIIRPGVYNIITTYENLALRALRQGEGRQLSISIHYPEATIFSDHPYTILTAPWVGSAERDAARLLGEFLLSPAEQTIAMREYGFRPANPQVTIDLDDSGSLFGRYADYGLRLDLAAQIAIPSPEVVAELLNTWRSATGR